MRLEAGDPSRSFPQFNGVAVNQLLSPLLGGFLVLASDVDPVENVAVHAENVYFVFFQPCHRRSYLGGCSSEDRSHSLMCKPVSAWRALRRTSSRAAPGGSLLASSLRRFASWERRSSRDWLCLKRRRCMAISLALAVPTPHGSALVILETRSIFRLFQIEHKRK